MPYSFRKTCAHSPIYTVNVKQEYTQVSPNPNGISPTLTKKPAAQDVQARI